MSVSKGSNGKYRVGKGKAIYGSKTIAEKVDQSLKDHRKRKKK